MEFIKNVIRGITIGIANVVPGVSGGTIMVSLGIYDELLQAVTGSVWNGDRNYLPFLYDRLSF